MNKRIFFVAFVAVAISATAAILLLFFSVPLLVIIDNGTGLVVFSERIEQNELFSVSYIHSVNKSEVEEYYFIKDKAIYLDSARYSAFGAGMATEVKPPQVLELKDGQMIISNFNLKIDRLSYFVSVVSQNTLHIGGKSIRLDELAEPKSSLTFEVWGDIFRELFN